MLPFYQIRYYLYLLFKLNTTLIRMYTFKKCNNEYTGITFLPKLAVIKSVNHLLYSCREGFNKPLFTLFLVIISNSIY